MSHAAFLRALRADLGASDAISTEPDDLRTYGRDWTKVYEPAPLAIAFPRRSEDVVAIVRRCAGEGIPIVPSGGRTGLAAGAVAARGELVVSMEKMRAIGAVDRRALSVEAQAGAVTAQVHAHCEPHGLTWPIDFASKGSSQVGGNVATNAGGVKVIRYGLTRHWVLGLEVVTARGELLSLNGALEKNNTGLDLRQLFIGSEGTLGIVTGATLKLTRLPSRLDVLLFALRDLPSVLRLFGAARGGPFVISAFETFTDRCYARLRRHRGLAMPIDASAPHYVLLEVEAQEAGALEGWLARVIEDDLVLDGVLASSAAQARAIWDLREGISESLAATGMPHKNDVGLPIASLESFTGELERTIEAQWPGFEVCVFGHIGDGNLHVNVMKPDAMSKDDFLAHARASDAAMFELVRKHRGSVSAEHGIGLLKKSALPYSRTPEEIAMLRAIKKALDPDGLLNPGKIFD